MLIVSPINQRRPVSREHAKTFKAVERFILTCDAFTEKDAARATKQNRTTVRQALMRLERLGVVSVAGYQPRGKGRPMRVWRR